MSSAKNTVLFYAQALLGRKTGVGFYNSVLLDQIQKQNTNHEICLLYFENPFSRKHTRFLKSEYPDLKLRAHRFIPKKVALKLLGTFLEPRSGLLWPGRYDSAIFPNFYMFGVRQSALTALSIPDLAFLKHPEVLPDARRGFLGSILPSGPDYLLRVTEKQIPKADIILTISDSIKQEIQEEFSVPKSKIIVTTLAPKQVSLASVGKNKRYEIPDKYFLFVGTLEPRKNILTLLSAYESLNKEIRLDYTLVLAGGIGWKHQEILQKIKTMKKSGLKVQYTGYIDQEYKNLLYKNADIYIQPSLYEGFGMPLLEAMSHNIPVICSDIPVFREVAEKSAIFFNRKNPNSLASAITDLLSDKAKQRSLIASGAKRVVEHRKNLNGVKTLLDKLYLKHE